MDLYQFDNVFSPTTDHNWSEKVNFEIAQIIESFEYKESDSMDYFLFSVVIGVTLEYLSNSQQIDAYIDEYPDEEMYRMYIALSKKLNESEIIFLNGVILNAQLLLIEVSNDEE